MAEPKIEEPIREFLTWVEEQRRQGTDVRALIGVVQALRGEVASARAEVATVRTIALEIAKDRLVDLDRGDRHGRRLDTLEHAMALVTRAPQMANVPNYSIDLEERTGQHNLHEIRRQQEALEERFKLAEQQRKEDESRKRESGLWWKRQRVVWIAAAVGFIAATAISTGCSVAVARLMPPQAAAK